MKLSARRFPDTSIRRRELPGMRDGLGEWLPGQTADVVLRASIQPLALADADLEGGDQLEHRIKVFVLPRRERVGSAAGTLLWSGSPLAWSGSPLAWSVGFEITDVHALAAAFEAAGADRVRVEDAWFVVEESRTWRSFTRATLLRET